MKKVFNMMLSVCTFWAAAVVRVNAGAEETIIYIQEDRGSELMAFLGSMQAESRINIVSATVAFLCASALIILAINHKNP